MGLFPFLSAFAGIKGTELVNKVANAVVALDPDVATEADLKVMETDLDNAGKMISKLRTELLTEQQQFTTIDAQYRQLMGAAEVLQKQIDEPSNTDRRTSLEESLAKLLSKIETIAPELDADDHDVQSTQALLSDAETAYKEKATALVSARKNLERAKHDLQHAKIEEDRSKQRANTAAEVAGLRKSTSSGLNTALNLMQKSAAESRDRARSNEMKTTVLTEIKSSGEDDDPNIKAALAATSSTVPEQSLSSRLSSLKKRM